MSCASRVSFMHIIAVPALVLSDCRHRTSEHCEPSLGVFVLSACACSSWENSVICFNGAVVVATGSLR